MGRAAIAVASFAPLVLPTTLLGHPLGDRTFDRGLQIVIETNKILIDYELGLSELTIATELIQLAEPGTTPPTASGAIDRYQEIAGPVMARGIVLTVAGKEVPVAVESAHSTRTDHVQYTFRLVAKADLAAGIAKLTLHDTNFAGERGYRRIALDAGPNIRIESSTATARLESVPLVPTWQMSPEEEERASMVDATFAVNAPMPQPAVAIETRDSSIAPDAAPVSVAINAAVPQSRPEASPSTETAVRDWLMSSSSNPWLWPAVLIGAFILGMAHALKPGHGKTMVAAYLVGEHGTVYHAVLLGVITTLTHTGSVLFVALMLGAFGGTRLANQESLRFWLTLVSGVVIAILGATLLWRRLRGQEDILHRHGPGGHVHLPDGSIARLSGDGATTEPGNSESQGRSTTPSYCEERRTTPSYDEGSSATPPYVDDRKPLRATNLVVLGLSGGMIPCEDAILILLAAIGAGLLTSAVAILLAFSAGLAFVLILVGVLVVKLKGFAERRRGSEKWGRRLQVASASLITVIGLVLCVEAF